MPSPGELWAGRWLSICAPSWSWTPSTWPSVSGNQHPAWSVTPTTAASTPRSPSAAAWSPQSWSPQWAPSATRWTTPSPRASSPPWSANSSTATPGRPERACGRRSSTSSRSSTTANAATRPSTTPPQSTTSSSTHQQHPRPNHRVHRNGATPHREAFFMRYAACPRGPRREDDQRFRWSWMVWWACQDLNLGPHPYQQNAGNHCAKRRSCRSRSTVEAEVMWSHRVQLCALIAPATALLGTSAVLAVVVLASVVPGTLTGPLGRPSAARLAVVPATVGSGAYLPPVVGQREADLHRERRIVGAEVGEEGVPARPCHCDCDPPWSVRAPAPVVAQALGLP